MFVCVSLCVEVVREREHCVTSTLKNAFDVDTVKAGWGAGRLNPVRSGVDISGL